MDLEDATLSMPTIEHFAEDTLIKITPRFNHDVLELLSGRFGPFKSGIPVFVPLWWAEWLKKKNLCSFHVPRWLTVGLPCVSESNRYIHDRGIDENARQREASSEFLFPASPPFSGNCKFIS